MDRSVSPLHVHVGGKAPVHVHLSSKPKSKSRGGKLTTSQRLAKSFAEMSAGRPSLRATDHLRASSRMKCGDFVKESTNQGPWIPPPGKSSTTRPSMLWQGPTHSLQITPGDTGTADTVLRMSDLLGSGNDTEIVLGQAKDGIGEKVENLKKEMSNLRAEVDLDRSLREWKETNDDLEHSRRSLKEKELEIQDLQEELNDSIHDKVKLREAVSQMKKDINQVSKSSKHLESQRELLMKKLIEAEMDSSSMSKQLTSLKTSLRKLEREKQATSSQVNELSNQRNLLLDKLSEFEYTNKSLRKLLKSQHSVESTLEELNTQREMLLRRLSEAEDDRQLMKQKMTESQTKAIRADCLAESLRAKEEECHTLVKTIKTLESQLIQTNADFTELEMNVEELKRKSEKEREVVKKMTKQQREEQTKQEEVMETTQSRLEEMRSELHHSRSKSSKLVKEKVKLENEVESLSQKVHQLETVMCEARETSKLSLESVNARLLEKTRELNTFQIENEKLKAALKSNEERLQRSEAFSSSQMSTLKSELTQSRTTISQYEGLVSEYKAKADKLHQDSDELRLHLQSQEQETERAKQEGFIQMEKTRMKLQQQITELETYPEALKIAEQKIRTLEGKLADYEERFSDQTRLIAELTIKAEQQFTTVDDLKEKGRASSAENSYLQSKVEVLEKRLQESDHQNRDLVVMVGKKEERIQHLESRIEESMADLTQLRKSYDSAKDDSRRQVDHLKDKTVAKERTSLSRIADLESQLSRANLSLSQLKRSKEEAERRYTSKITEMKERYEQASNAHRSLQNYVSLLKSSYVNMFSDLGTSPTKLA